MRRLFVPSLCVASLLAGLAWRRGPVEIGFGHFWRAAATEGR